MKPKLQINYTIVPPNHEELIASIPIRQDITVLPADQPQQLKLGWIVNERLGEYTITNNANTGDILVFNTDGGTWITASADGITINGGEY